MKKLGTKPCVLCGAPVAGVLRSDRAAYRYPRRCVECGYKWDERTKAERLRRVAEKRAPDLLPIGSRRLHRSTDKLTYWEVKVAQPNVWDYEHRVVMAAHLGRPLRSDEHVHHGPNGTLDNSLSNLQLLLGPDHTREHLSITRWARDYDQCRDCGRSDRPHYGRGLCSACIQRDLARQRGHWPKRPGTIILRRPQ